MATETLTQRVLRLEEQMRTMLQKESASQAAPVVKDWRKTVGMFRDDPIMGQIIEAGRRIREEDRLRAQS